MAGYDGYSKSNNAIAAEADGRFPATKLAKRLKCSSAAIKRHLKTTEYHHTSSRYNSTDYYDEPVLIALADGVDHTAIMEYYGLDSGELTTAVAMLGTLRADKPNSAQRHTGCWVKWLTWSGSRKRPVAEEHEARNVDITVSGSFITIHLESGDVRKKATSNGTVFTLGKIAE